MYGHYEENDGPWKYAIPKFGNENLLTKRQRSQKSWKNWIEEVVQIRWLEDEGWRYSITCISIFKKTCLCNLFAPLQIR